MKHALGQLVRSATSPQTRRKVVGLRHRARTLTPASRALPSFLLVGAQRAGTSTLFTELSRNEGVTRGLRKETEYFSKYYSEGARWYRAHFPTTATLQRLGTRTFEATPDYLYWPTAPERAASMLPEAFVVVILRDPVTRAWSHFQHTRRLGYEPLGFMDALLNEEARTAAQGAEFSVDPDGVRSALRHSYASRGNYSEQLAGWLRHYPRERIHVLFFEDLVSQPEVTFGAICGFLGLPAQRVLLEHNHSYAKGIRTARDAMPADARDLLESKLRPLDGPLEDLVGMALPWSHHKP